MKRFHERCFDAHRKYAEELGISAADWWRRYENEKTDPVSDEQLEQLDFYAYYRCYPMRNQDVAVIGTNPLFKPSGPGDDVFDFAALGRDFDAIMEKSISTMAEYFTDYSNHPRYAWLGLGKDDDPLQKGVFRPLATETEILDENQYKCDDFYENRFYDSVYYTNLFKFGSSPGFGDLPNPDGAIDVGTPFLKEELDHVDPEVVIMLGRTYPKLSESDGITTIHGTHQSYEGYDTIPHIHPSGYKQNKSDGDYARYKRTITKLLE